MLTNEVKTDMQEFISREKARGDCYRFLSACFYQPKKDIFIQEGLFGNLSASLKLVSPEASAVASELEKEFPGYTEEELAVDYARLFVGPNELIAPPYGSIYLDKERRVMGDSTIEVINMYEQAGLSMNKDFPELPDHIAAELEFMHYLIFKEIEAIEKSDIESATGFMKMQDVFIDRFLGRWIVPFCKRIQEGTGNLFYKNLADCVSIFVMTQNAGYDIPKALNIKAGIN